jgi:hypothetical protein
MACNPAPQTAEENPSYVLNYTGDNLTRIDMTVNGVEYRKALTYTGSQLDTIGEWEKQ